ncbi:MAG: acetyl-CoA acetyltransferase [Actinobacteria bacterium]|nr:acetyl-CoA acetyltransferase [Actinomycetota bacterium]MDI6831124.1 acetyl-CoA acetyltransferase [Actinomycetota bacterium]
MRERVAIAGLGYTAFTSVSPGSSYRELTYEAAVKAYEEAGIEPKDVDSFVCTSEDMLEGYSISDEYCNDQLGAVLKPAQTIPGDFLHSLAVGVMHILTEQFDIVVVQALSKASNMKTIPDLLNFAFDPVLNRPLDVTAYALAGLEMNRFLTDGRATREQCAAVVVKNKANALKNPLAGYGASISIEHVLESEPVAEPVRLLDIAPYADGAVVMVLCSEKLAPSLTDKPVWITGIGWSTDSPTIESRDWSGAVAVRLAGDMAYRMAGITCPAREIDLAEVNDEISFKELQHLEALRLFEPGQAGRATEDGQTSPGGALPVNVSGGGLGVGHLFECSGAQKVLELVLQLRGEAGSRQVPGAGVGLAQAWRGIPTTSAAVAILSA